MSWEINLKGAKNKLGLSTRGLNQYQLRLHDINVYGHICFKLEIVMNFGICDWYNWCASYLNMANLSHDNELCATLTDDSLWL